VDLSLLAELKRRRVFRALVGYGIAAFAILQIIEPVMHGLHWPDAVLTYVVVGLAVGFPVVVTLAWIFDVNEGRIERTAGKPVGGRLALALVGIGVLAAAPGVLWYFFIRERPAPVAESAAGPSIAVLPLVNLSSDKEQEYFSDGLTEELLNLLAQVPGLHVAARTSAFAFKGKSENIGEIARTLHVSTVLEGSVRKAGEQIRITTQLINAADGYHLWSATYDRKLTDVFAIQDEIARAVVDALKLKLLQPPSSKERRTSSTEAYNQYLLGRQFFQRNNVDGFRRAKKAFEKAVELDPEYAPAWASLGLARFWVADASDTLAEVLGGQQRALEAAEKAIALRPDLPDGYRARGFVRVPTLWDWEGSRADFLRALQLLPNDPDTLGEYGSTVLRALNRLPEAAANLRRATELDPLNPRIWSALGNTLAMMDQRGPARDAFNRSLELSPDQSFTPYNMSVTYLLDHQPGEALALVQRTTNEVFRLSGVALAQHDLGHAAESQQALDQLIARWHDSAAYQIAQNYAWRGERERALDWLERAFRQHDGGMANIKPDALLRGLHGEPRFKALLAKMNLPAD
jgi:TolB-like protein/lipoprotein NlpI